MENNLNLKALLEQNSLNSIKNEVLFVVDSNDIITDIESASSFILGINPEDMIGKKFSSYLIDEYIDFSFFDSMLPKDKVTLTFKAEYSFTHVDISYQHLLDAENNIIGAYGSIVDISNYIEYKKRFDMINKLLDNSKDIVYQYQIFPEQKFTYISKSLEAVLGHSLETNYNDPTHVFKITHPEDLELLMNKSTGNVDFSKPIITRWQHTDGHYIWMEDYAIPFYDNRGNLLSVQGICRDISQRVELEEKLNHYKRTSA
ncbi:PAS domain S-box protein [Clostridium swellfunianum]|uniref:PAS domain-containing protein n=1 Tax=Clostridium swellfunianum TaxID=1367462 RepID=UPI0020307504|nr:PAS domain S-box protein [Clostridium swellfunianum]MCM0648233.1 PAS domain S-box protein [Clostridium swellfunianum]